MARQFEQLTLFGAPDTSCAVVGTTRQEGAPGAPADGIDLVLVSCERDDRTAVLGRYAADLDQTKQAVITSELDGDRDDNGANALMNAQ